MHFDALTLACVAAELRHNLLPGRVQQVLQIDEHAFALEIYAHGQRHNLLISTDPQKSRLHLLSEKPRRGPDLPTPLLQLLRKYVRDALLSSISQPQISERVVRLEFEHHEFGATSVVVETMGRLSNLLLLNPKGMILDCLRRVPAGEKAQRVLLPGRMYTPPPAQIKLPPLDDGAPDYYDRLAAALQNPQPLWKVLIEQVAGVSPSQAREIAWRSSPQHSDSDSAADQVELLAVVAALQSLWQPTQTGDWQPGVWIEGERVVGFSPYAAHVRGEFVATASISAALERYFAAQISQKSELPASTLDGYHVQRQQVLQQIEQARGRLQRQLSALDHDEPAPGAAAKARSEAEWLLAYHSQITPDQRMLVVDLGDETLEIALDPSRSALVQAQQLFKQAAKFERAAIIIPQRRAQLQADRDFLEQLAVDVMLANNQQEIAATRAELEKLGLEQPTQRANKNRGQPAPKIKLGQPLEFKSQQGLTILVGRSAQQNEKVTFDLSHPRDLWLHVRGVAGAHVIIRNSGGPVAEATLQQAAQLAAYHSKLRGEKSAPVIYSERRFVQHAPGGRPGQVLVRNEQIMHVAAEMPK